MERPAQRARRADWIAYADHLEEQSRAVTARLAKIHGALEQLQELADQRLRTIHRLTQRGGPRQ